MKDSFENIWRKRFQQYGSAHNDDALIAGWSKTGLLIRFENFKKCLKANIAEKLWLDVGCGAGTYSSYLVSKGANVIGVDYSEPTLLKAKEKVVQIDRWILGSVTGLPIRSSSVDGVICFGVLQALSSPGGAIEELVRVVKTGGELWIDALNADCLPHKFELIKSARKKEQTRVRYDSLTKLVSELENAGLHDIEWIWLPILPKKLYFLQWIFNTNFMRFFIKHSPYLGRLMSHSVVIHGVV